MLAAAAAIAVIVISTVATGGGGGENQVQAPSPSPLQTEARPAAPVNTAPPEACAIDPTPAEEEEQPTFLDDLEDGAASDDPNFEVEFGVQALYDTAGAKSDLMLEMIIRQGNVSPSALSLLIPPDWQMTPGCQVPIGLAVGTLRWDVRVGRDGNACTQPGPLQFTMLNATTDRSNTVPFLDSDNNGTPDFAEDKDHTGRRDAIERYPDFLNRIFPGRTPIRRTAGVFTYTDPPVLAQTLAFESLNDSDGTTLVVILQNIGDPEAAPGDAGFTDYCTPTGFRLTEYGAAQSDAAFYTNPEAGDYVFLLTAFGEPDADEDGIENALDTCPFDVNVGEPDRRGEGDADEDGLDAACDPNDFQSKPDEDGDGYLNRRDLCPLTAGEDPSTQADRDDDDIGDECDTSGNGPDVADGEVPYVVRAVEVPVR
jgi:hypothetical protein